MVPTDGPQLLCCDRGWLVGRQREGEQEYLCEQGWTSVPDEACVTPEHITALKLLDIAMQGRYDTGAWPPMEGSRDARSKAVAEEKKTKVAAVKDINAQRNEELVKILEEFVVIAKEGHISDLAIIGKVRGAPITEFHWETDNPLELIGALELAKSEVCEALLVDADEDGDEDD